MTATLISVDFKKGKVTGRTNLAAADKKPGIDIAQNKRLINDLKSMMDEIADQIDLYPAILLIPNEEKDLYVNINGAEMSPADIKAIGRIHQKLRERSNVKP